MSQAPRTARIAPLALALTLAAVTTLTLSAADARASEPAASAPPGLSAPGPVSHRPACAAPHADHAGCLAIIDANGRGDPLTGKSATAAGLHPYNAAALQAAYKLPSAQRGHRQTIAIVDAYDDPHASADLAVYRKTNHLPGCAGLRCLRKVNQHGGASPPKASAGWALEESLDLDMASAICPYCRLILVEASSNSDNNLGLAVDEAARLGADVISNSYSGPESNDEPALARHYDHPGIAITVSSGDNGFGVSAPAAYPTVIAAGGTSLYRSAARARLGRDRMAVRRLRLLRLHRQAALAEGQAVRPAHRGRYGSGRRPRHAGRRL